MKQPRSLDSRAAGFTIVELLVVLAIIVVLSTAALPGFNAAVEETRIEQGISDLQSIWLAERQYFLETGEFARELKPLVDAHFLPRRLLRDDGAFHFRIRDRGGLGIRLEATRRASGWSGAISLDQRGRLKVDLRDPRGDDYKR